jgi:hypothetical protein
MHVAPEAEHDGMRNFLVAAAVVLLSQTAWADGSADVALRAPETAHWEAVAAEVHAHPLFRGIDLEIESRPAFLLGDSPLAMRPPQSPGEPCTLFIGTEPDVAWARIGPLLQDGDDLNHFMRLAVAHELGHCLRAAQHDALRALLRPAVAVDRHDAHLHDIPWHDAVSREEAYADAYALAYFQDVSALHYARAFALLRRVRIEPAFDSPSYRVDSLYRHLARDGFGRRGPLAAQVERAVRAAGLAAR